MKKLLLLCTVLFCCRHRTGLEAPNPGDIASYIPSQVPETISSLARDFNDTPVLANVRTALSDGNVW